MSDSSSGDEKNIDLKESYKSWKVTQLKEFLQARGVPLGENPTKKKLLRNVYYTAKLNLPIQKTPQEEDEEIKERICQKLKLKSGVQLPHPDEIGNWVVEKEAVVKLFPSTTYSDVENYAHITNSMKALKEGQSLYSSNHVTSVAYNSLSDAVKVRYIRGTVVPQTRVNDDPYDTWVCLNSDGSIFTAECGCLAGYGESCKHIFALLLFVEEHVRLGSNVTCTSVKQKWGAKSSKRKIHKPDLIQNISVKKVKLGLEKPLTKLKRCLFDPRPISSRNSNFTEKDWKAVAEATKGNSAVIYLKPEIQFEYLMSQITTCSTVAETVPLTIDQAAILVQNNYGNESLTMKYQKLLDNISITEQQVKLVAEKTLLQSNSLLWKSYRVGKISSSNAHAVIAKFDKHLSVKNEKAAFNLCAQILGYKKNAYSKAIQWGNMFEPYARKRYIKEMQKSHKSFKCVETGLLISTEHPYLAASPDGITTCTCCGTGLVEIKCPWTSRQKKVSEYVKTNQSFLELITGTNTYTLKNNHPYRTQIQHQLYITGYLYADLYVCLSSDQHRERIYADPNYYQNISKFKKFFSEFIVPELFSKEIEKKQIIDSILIDLITKSVDESEGKTLTIKFNNDIADLVDMKLYENDLRALGVEK